ncbi:hypothetical protein Q361_11747 [Flavobacterium croceum DSM 17960]|uniref:Uncharacterized protein n=1 Tax=Flavobacterium croceum DSM 17960 TaxID=1121886 RepID=A0A2S4N6J7_9FLAO|nr:hypothetical protein Q361_11747 [Flavobacterium croceum DSM 17960]
MQRKNKHLVNEMYIDNDTHYIIFNSKASLEYIYLFAYKYAIKHKLMAGRAIYRDNIYQITLTKFQ